MYNLFSLLGGPFAKAIEKINETNLKWIAPVLNFLDSIIVPITIIVAIAGAIWVIWLGIKLAKAEDAENQKKARKNLINVVVAILVSLIVFWVITWLAVVLSTQAENNPIISSDSSDTKTVFRYFLGI